MYTAASALSAPCACLPAGPPAGPPVESARFAFAKVDDIVLAGGSSAIPKVQQLVREYFGKEPLKVRSKR